MANVLSRRLSEHARKFDPKKKTRSKLQFKPATDPKVAKRIKNIQSLIPRIKRSYGAYVQRYARQYGARYDVNPEKLEALVYSMIAAESAGNPQAVSPVGAAGLMQLMPRTWKGAGVTDPHDPKQNVKAGTKIISKYMSRYGGDSERALAAYNAGSGNLRAIEAGRMDTPVETQEYVSSILSSYLTEPAPAQERPAPPPPKKRRAPPEEFEEEEEIEEG